MTDMIMCKNCKKKGIPCDCSRNKITPVYCKMCCNTMAILNIPNDHNIDASNCKHKKLIRKKELWKCTICESSFTASIQDNDKDYVWVSRPYAKSDVDEFIGSWWHRPDEDKTIPDKVIKNKICEVLTNLDSDITTMVHINQKDVTDYIKKIQYRSDILKNWFYILNHFQRGEQNYQP